MKLFSTDFIVLTSSEAISDLLEKRSSIYSDRVRHLLIPVTCSFSLMYDCKLAYDSDARAVCRPRCSYLIFR